MILLGVDTNAEAVCCVLETIEIDYKNINY